MTATPEQINALGGEIPKTEPELNIPDCMNRPKFESLGEMQKHDNKIKRRERIDAERVTQIVMVAAMIAAVVVMAVAR